MQNCAALPMFVWLRPASDVCDKQRVECSGQTIDPRFCHGLLDGLSTLHLAQIGFCHQGKGVYHTKNKSRCLE